MKSGLIYLTYQAYIVNVVDMSNNTILESYLLLRRSIALLRAAEVKELEFGHNQIGLLYKLSLGKASMGELAEYTLSDNASITRTVRLLEKSGYVHRHQSEKDRRVYLIELAPKGKALAKKARKIRDSIGFKLEQVLSPKEREQFSVCAQKIAAALKL